MLKYSGFFGIRSSALLGTLMGLAACATPPSASNESTPESNANFALGVAAYSSGQYPAALDYFSRAEAIAPRNPSYEMHTALAMMSLERYADSEKKFLSACSRVTEYPDCWNNLAAFYLRTNRPQDALTYAKRAAEATSYQTPEVALSNQARALIDLRRNAEALEVLKKAERIGQANCSISLLKSKALTRMKYYDLAVESAKRGESMCPSDARAHFWVAYTQIKNGRTDLAKQKYRSILETFRDEKTVFQTNKYLEQTERRIPAKEPQL